jgi:hypothetical protein
MYIAGSILAGTSDTLDELSQVEQGEGFNGAGDKNF